MSCFDTVPFMVPSHRSRLPDRPPLFIWSTCGVYVYVFVIREGWADTSNGEKCSASAQRRARSFQLLSFDSDIQVWVMGWGKPKYLKMNGRKKKALDVFQRENTSEWDTGSSTRFDSLSRTECRCAFVRFWQISLRLKAPLIFGY